MADHFHICSVGLAENSNTCNMVLFDANIDLMQCNCTQAFLCQINVIVSKPLRSLSCFLLHNEKVIILIIRILKQILHDTYLECAALIHEHFSNKVCYSCILQYHVCAHWSHQSHKNPVAAAPFFSNTLKAWLVRQSFRAVLQFESTGWCNILS